MWTTQMLFENRHPLVPRTCWAEFGQAGQNKFAVSTFLQCCERNSFAQPLFGLFRLGPTPGKTGRAFADDVDFLANLQILTGGAVCLHKSKEVTSIKTKQMCADSGYRPRTAGGCQFSTQQTITPASWFVSDAILVGGAVFHNNGEYHRNGTTLTSNLTPTFRKRSVVLPRFQKLCCTS